MIGMKVELLVAQGGLPDCSRRLVSSVRDQVNQWRVDQRLPRLRGDPELAAAEAMGDSE